MHELSIAESLLSLALEHAERAGAKRVARLNLVIGDLSNFVDESIQFCWDAITQDTLCQGAVLQFQRIPAQLACLECGTAYTLDRELAPCPGCGSSHVKVTAGEDFRLDSIDVET